MTVALNYTGGLEDTGDTKGPFYISLASQVSYPRTLRRSSIDARAAGDGHLAGDRDWPFHTGRTQRSAFPPWQMASDRD